MIFDATNRPTYGFYALQNHFEDAGRYDDALAEAGRSERVLPSVEFNVKQVLDRYKHVPRFYVSPLALKAAKTALITLAAASLLGMAVCLAGAAPVWGAIGAAAALTFLGAAALLSWCHRARPFLASSAAVLPPGIRVDTFHEAWEENIYPPQDPQPTASDRTSAFKLSIEWPDRPACSVIVAMPPRVPDTTNHRVAATRGNLKSRHVATGLVWQQVFAVTALHGASSDRPVKHLLPGLHLRYGTDLPDQLLTRLRNLACPKLFSQIQAAVHQSWNFDWLLDYRELSGADMSTPYRLSAIALVEHRDFFLLAAKGACTAHLVSSTGVQALWEAPPKGVVPAESFCLPAYPIQAEQYEPLELNVRSSAKDAGPCLFKLMPKDLAGKALLLAPPGVYAEACVQRGAEETVWTQRLVAQTKPGRKSQLAFSQVETFWGRMLVYHFN